MAQKSKNPISLKFLFFVTVISLIIFFYATTPNDMKKIQKSKTYEEMLEYTNTKTVKSNTNNTVNKTGNSRPNKVAKSEPQTQKRQQPTEENTQQKISFINYPTVQKNNDNNSQDIETINKYDEEFNRLLDNMVQYPAKSIASVETIVNKILEYKGYPKNTIRIVSDEKSGLQSHTQGSYVAAYFNMQTGNIHINKVPLYSLRMPEIIAILAHELDHFDKISKVCKSMGAENFIKMLEDNKMKDINTEFWRRAPLNADISNFNSEYYKGAILRYITQGSIDLTSTYADLYRLSEHMRNPLELSAYEVSDYVFDYFNVPNQEGPLRKLISKFNSVDWAIYNLIKDNKIISRQRIAFFDYFFMQAILDSDSRYRDIYYNCINEHNGDMTNFWLMFENANKSLYSKNTQIDRQTYANITQLLERTEANAKVNLTNDIVCKALKYKVNTLLNNIVFPNAVKNIQNAASDYIQYIHKMKVSNPKDELQMILILICFENELYRNNTREKLSSLYYLKMPEILNKEYELLNKNQKYHFIYNNQAFQDEMNKRKASNPSLTEQTLLIDLLFESRPFLKINY